MGSNPPSSWVACSLGDVIKVQNGYAFPSKEFRKEGVPLIRQSNLGNNTVSLEKCTYLSSSWLKEKPEFILRKNDVLIGMSGSIGKPCVYDLEKPALQNQRTGKIVPRSTEHIEWRFVWEYLKTIERRLLDKGKGLGVLNVSATDIESLPFRLAPLNEQRRIVLKLQKLLDKVNDSQERLEKIPSILKRFRQSILAAACSGRLTADWRKETANGNGLPASWKKLSVGDVIESLKYGTAQKCSYEKKGMPVLRIPNVVKGAIDHSDLKYATLSKKELDSLRLQSGDILIIRSNGSVSLVGRCALIRDREQGFAYAGYLIRIRPKKDIINAEYLNLILGSYDVRLQIELKARSTSGVNNINSDEVRALQIPLPPTAEQQEIIQRVINLFALADRLEVRYNKAHEQVDKLTPSLLSKAFRGELVEQNPNDEPANILLEKIKATKGKE